MQIIGFYKNKIYELTHGKTIFTAKTYIQTLLSIDVYLDVDNILYKGNQVIKENSTKIIFFNNKYILYNNKNNMYLYNLFDDTNLKIYNSGILEATIIGDQIYFLHEEKIKNYNISEKIIKNVLDLEPSNNKIFFDKNYMLVSKIDKIETEIVNLEHLESKVKTFSKKVKKIIFDKYIVIKIDKYKYLYDFEKRKIVMELNGRFIESKETYFNDRRLNKLFLVKPNLEFVEIPFYKKLIDEHIYLNCIINPILVLN